MSDDPSPDDDIDTLARLAAEQSPGDRADFLRDLCPDKKTRRAVWQRLYELSHVDGETGADSPHPDLSESLTVGDVIETGKQAAPTRVGPWRIRSRMGVNPLVTTYFAERDEADSGPDQRRAALKIASRALDKKNREKAQERFYAEIQILHQFQHPHIATLLDGGITSPDPGGESFRPYFAMEYVDGTPLYQFCNENGFGVEPRLQLFLQICEAVAYSHRNLIVRHDLKPWDVLITPAPDEDANDAPTATLLDVGVETALKGARGQTGGLRRLEDLHLDIRYTSPEQVQHTLVTTASDVYSLGVVLCELLTGELPYVNFWKNSIPGLAETVGNAAVDPPSQRVPSDGNPSTPGSSTKQAYGISPEALRRTLEGELDAITMKALRKVPEHRYPSAVELGQDIGRFLNGEPVDAPLDE